MAVKLLDPKTMTLVDLAKTIDHSLLKPEMTPGDIEEGCKLALEHDVASVCVKPSYVPIAAEILKGSKVEVGTVNGFPHGANTSAVKAFEAEESCKFGATEIDTVINIGWMLAGEYDKVREDVATVKKAIGDNMLKVIFENHFLSSEQIATACKLVEEAGGDYVKTSTGFAGSGAKVEDLKLMRASVSDHVGVKAAGGVRTTEAALEVIGVGCTRVGATATVAILDGFKQAYPDRV